MKLATRPVSMVLFNNPLIDSKLREYYSLIINEYCKHEGLNKDVLMPVSSSYPSASLDKLIDGTLDGEYSVSESYKNMHLGIELGSSGKKYSKDDEYLSWIILIEESQMCKVSFMSEDENKILTQAVAYDNFNMVYHSDFMPDIKYYKNYLKIHVYNACPEFREFIHDKI